MDLLAGLTAAQADAVSHIDGPLLILAGAGSGKTRTITHRVAWLVAQGVPAWQILAITFTNKAAQEMRTRIERLVSEPGVFVSTFHSLCARLLRTYIPRLRTGHTPQFAIYDEDDQRACLVEAMRGLDLDPKTWPPKGFAHRISEAKQGLLSPDDILESSLDPKTPLVYRAYETILASRNALDFDDLLVRMVQLLGVSDVRAELQDRFQYILVDEYQDTNHPQYRIVEALGAKHRNIAVCGDPDQSIYAWRGADIRNILEFEESYPDCRVVRLEQNWRSTGHILAAAQGLIEHNLQRKPKTLFTEAGLGRPVEIRTYNDDSHEARSIALDIQSLIALGTHPREIACFYRTNALSRPLEQALILRNIPYQIVGAVEFYRRKEVKDLLAWLHLLANPRDDLAFLRVVNTPPRGIGARTVETLKACAHAMSLSLLETLDTGGWEEAVSPRARAALQAFGSLFDGFRALPESPLQPLARAIIEETGYIEYLKDMEASEEADRKENLDQLLFAISEHDREHPEGGILGFLEKVALVSDVDRWDREAPRVSLMTLHLAKGLEFDAVFIAGCEEGILPHMRSQSETGIEEERRLLYVGMTRARKNLSLSHTRQRSRYGTLELASPSPFLDEIPEENTDAARPQRRAPEILVPTGRGQTAFTIARDLARGERVDHDVFGPGTVVDVLGHGPGRRAVIRFDRVGEKTLVLQYAQLARLAAETHDGP